MSIKLYRHSTQLKRKIPSQVMLLFSLLCVVVVSTLVFVGLFGILVACGAYSSSVSLSLSLSANSGISSSSSSSLVHVVIVQSSSYLLL